MEISCKLFTDDVEDALLKLNHSKVDLARSSENKVAREQVIKYLHERLQIVINGIAVKPELLGFETENDVTWFYLESAVNVGKGVPVKLHIKNSLLYDYLPEQTNLIQVIWNAQERTERLVNPEKDVDLTLPSP